MKKKLFASAFALIGTFAFANQINYNDYDAIDELKSNNSQTAEFSNKKCDNFEDHCGGIFTFCQNSDEPWKTDKIEEYAEIFCED
ncbi:hypothetical protein [Chishuiella sp.]|uniref:hypothetical protein n=1 Tax=Chishuiella sp. TaxID=1969467 RepID=UPI0028A95B4A|nr:hypothetical protein [Chishuiella sp.]